MLREGNGRRPRKERQQSWSRIAHALVAVGFSNMEQSELSKSLAAVLALRCVRTRTHCMPLFHTLVCVGASTQPAHL